MGKPDYGVDATDGGKEEESYPMVAFKDGSKDTDLEGEKSKPEKKKEDKDLMDLISQHAEKSSLSGVAFIHSSKYWTVKIIWTFLLLVSLGVMVYHLHELGKKFFQYEKQTQVSLTKGTIRFPAITLCNVNVMRNSKVSMASKQLQALIKRVDPDGLTKDVDAWKLEYVDEMVYLNDRGEVVEGPGDDSSSSNSNRTRRDASKDTWGKATAHRTKSRKSNFFDDFNITDVMEEDALHEEDFSRSSYKDSWESESQAASLDKIYNMFTAMYFKENSFTRRTMGHQIQDMLIQCSFTGRKCVQRNFTLVASSTMGNCYTLQYDKFVSRQGGPSNGLSLMIYLEPDEYIPGITNSKGAQIVIHEPKTVPFPGSEGIAISAGMSTSIGMRKLDIKRLGQPHGDCRENKGFQMKYGMKYTTQTCLQVCLLERIKEDCGCYDETKPIFYNKFLKYLRNMKPCQQRKDLMMCMSDVTWNFNINHESCLCYSPCRETVYRQTVASKPWPNMSFAKLIANTVCKEKPKSRLCQLKDTMDEVALREHFLKVTIFFESLDYESLNEEEDYTTFQFISDVGGTIGLYVGLSILGAFEFVHLLGAVLRHFLCRSFTPC